MNITPKCNKHNVTLDSEGCMSNRYEKKELPPVGEEVELTYYNCDTYTGEITAIGNAYLLFKHKGGSSENSYLIEWCEFELIQSPEDIKRDTVIEEMLSYTTSIDGKSVCKSLYDADYRKRGKKADKNYIESVLSLSTLTTEASPYQAEDLLKRFTILLKGE